MTLNSNQLLSDLVDLIKRASTQLPDDVISAIKKARDNEDCGSRARNTFDTILLNIDLAKKKETPVCQDTGTNIYHVHHPVGVSTKHLEELIKQATILATEQSLLRPNTVDSLTGKNTGNNIGTMAPFVHFEEWEKNEIKIDLLLKGGGSENVSGQFKLPDSKLKAGRDLNGVYKIVLNAINEAQGQGCAPGIIGVGIGGDRTTSMMMAKKQLFRPLDDTNPLAALNELEQKILQDANTLGIGPMGYGGKTTVLGVKIGHLHRLPASFFVSVAYMCWAARRATMTFEVKGEDSSANG